MWGRSTKQRRAAMRRRGHVTIGEVLAALERGPLSAEMLTRVRRALPAAPPGGFPVVLHQPCVHHLGTAEVYLDGKRIGQARDVELVMGSARVEGRVVYGAAGTPLGLVPWRP